MRGVWLWATLAAEVVVLSGCPRDPPAMGFLAVQVHVLERPMDDLSDLQGLAFTTSRIEVVHQTDTQSPEEVLTVDDQPHTFAVLLESGEVAQVALLPVPPGLVSQIRFVSTASAVTAAGETVGMKLPSGENTGLKLNAPSGEPFPIAVDQLTRVSAEFETNNRIIRNKGIGLLLKPTVPTILVQAPGTRPVPPQYSAGFLYVCFRDGTSSSRANQIHSDFGATLIRRSHRHLWDVVKLPSGKSEASALAEYRAKAEVELAMLSYNAQTENRQPDEWTNSTLPPQSYLRQTSSPEAWDLSTGSYFPVVAVVDNNVNIFSFDLQENIFLNPDEIPTQVTLDSDCNPLVSPLPLVTDTNGDGALSSSDMDVDGDGIITLADVNSPTIASLHKAALMARGETVPDVISLIELIRPEPPVRASDRATAVANGLLRCGLWEDLVDGAPANQLVDDIAGWDFVVDRNVPVSSVVNPGSAPKDGSGHGHQVTGVLAAIDNGSSLFSAAHLAPGYVGQTWKVRILPVRVSTIDAPTGFPEGPAFGDQGVYHDGLAYAVEMGADVVNMSFSLICLRTQIDPVPASFVCPDFTDKTAEFRRSFDVAGLSGSSALLVVGPVNQPVSLDSTDVLDLPAELLLPNQINVGSVDLSDVYRKDKVSFGPVTYQIAAPSQSMPVLSFGGAGEVFSGSGVFDDGVDGDLQAGNSLAAPQVAGAAALMLSANHALRGNPVEVRRRLLDAATVVTDLDVKVGGGRRLNVFKAVQAAQ